MADSENAVEIAPEIPAETEADHALQGITTRKMVVVPDNCKPANQMSNDGVCREPWMDKGDGKKK